MVLFCTITQSGKVEAKAKAEAKVTAERLKGKALKVNTKSPSGDLGAKDAMNQSS